MVCAQFSSGTFAVDFEYRPRGGREGNPLEVVCAAMLHIESGRTQCWWQDELALLSSAPFPTDESALFLAYNASAEMACFAALGWSSPKSIVDLYAEFRNLTNGKNLPAGKGLLGALAYFGGATIGASEKDEMRDLILAGGPWSEEQKRAILAYCTSDVMALKTLFLKMRGRLWS